MPNTTQTTEPYTLSFAQVNAAHLPQVGGKGANLGEMTRAGFPVPPGFCVTTHAYRAFVRTSPEFQTLLNSLDGISHEDLDTIRPIAARIRKHLEQLPIPDAIQAAIIHTWRQLGTQHAYAVRSSATAEDLPSTSFAGQQDTYLNVRGENDLLHAVRRCWASLFTDRAIVYRIKNGFKHRSVFLSVVVQQMVLPEVSGIMFTADPITGHRKTICIDASFGLGEALVGGLVTADLYQVRAGKLLTKRISRKEIAIQPLPGGGTETKPLPSEEQQRQALPDDRILQLAALGLKIQSHYGREQDIEWCLADGRFYIVQSRPITSLYPAPHAADGRLHLYISFGHVQMMPDAFKPLGISTLKTFAPVGDRSPSGESELLQEAGSRIYLDLNPAFRYRLPKRLALHVLPLVDEQIAKAVGEVLKRDEYLTALLPQKRLPLAFFRNGAPFALYILARLLFRKTDGVADKIEQSIDRLIAQRKKELQAASGAERIALVRSFFRAAFPDFLIADKLPHNVLPGVLAYRLISTLSQKWLGDTAELTFLVRSPPGNVTTEMGLALADLADVVRAHPGAIERLRLATDATFDDDLRNIPDGQAVRNAFQTFLQHYGMRCSGEIDITRPRWREAPTQLLPAIEGHLQASTPGQHRRDFEAAKQEAQLAAVRLVDRLRATRLGALKASVMKRLITVYRGRIGLREHPKFFIVQLLDIGKQAIMLEGQTLVKEGLLQSADEVFWFSLAELQEILQTRKLDRAVINARRERFERESTLRPPRVITSDGEFITAAAGAAVPAGALAGTAASPGVVEGRARIVRKLEGSKLQKGEILIAPYTDPAWTPLFPLAAGLVTEVGGLMTHGSVVAREYGIPAVVGVDRATDTIPDGALIRVNGSEGYIEILPETK